MLSTESSGDAFDTDWGSSEEDIQSLMKEIKKPQKGTAKEQGIKKGSQQEELQSTKSTQNKKKEELQSTQSTSKGGQKEELQSTQSTRKTSQKEALQSTKNPSQKEELKSAQSTRQTSQKEALQSTKNPSQKEELKSAQSTRQTSQKEELQNTQNPSQKEELQNTQSTRKTSQKEELQSTRKTSQKEELQSTRKTSQKEELQSTQNPSQKEELQNTQSTRKTSQKEELQNTQSTRKTSQKEELQSTRNTLQKEELQSTQSTRKSAQKEQRTVAVLVDMQNDFFPAVKGKRKEGPMSIAGGNEVLQQSIEYLRAHTPQAILVFQDTHTQNNISHPSFWVDEDGNHPVPFSTISARDIEDGVWSPLASKLKAYTLRYAQKVEKTKNHSITIWPYHAIENTKGHRIVNELQEFLNDWQTQPGHSVKYIEKGRNAYTECYSIFEAEIPLKNDASTDMQQELVDEIASFDNIVMIAPSVGIDHSIQDFLVHCPSKAATIMVLKAPVFPGFEETATELLSVAQQHGIRLIS
jgi:nicotinamidase/pyrazinamidase